MAIVADYEFDSRKRLACLRRLQDWLHQLVDTKPDNGWLQRLRNANLWCNRSQGVTIYIAIDLLLYQASQMTEGAKQLKPI